MPSVVGLRLARLRVLMISPHSNLTVSRRLEFLAMRKKQRFYGFDVFGVLEAD